MTEVEWLACEESYQMMEHLGWFERGWVSVSRKEFLCRVACWRRIISLLKEPGRNLVELYERRADNLVTENEVEAARVATVQACERGEENASCHALLDLEAARDAVGDDAVWRVRPAGADPLRNDPEQSRIENDLFRRASAVENAAQCDILRDVFGNPFRPVTFSPSWRTDTAVSLARQMYESRDFSAMPILADALQDAGCDNDDVLTHCRGPGPHVRGCWAVDLVLGRE